MIRVLDNFLIVLVCFGIVMIVADLCDWAIAVTDNI